MKTEKIVRLMLKSSNTHPQLGKLPREANYNSAINLANSCKDFADKGCRDEAMNVDSQQWREVIFELKKGCIPLRG